MLQKVGHINNLSEKLLASIPALAPGKKAVFELLGGVKDHRTGQIYYGSQEMIPCHEWITDPFTGNTVEIGVPKEIKDQDVLSWSRFKLGSMESGAMMTKRFELHGNNPMHRSFYAFLWLSSKRGDNPYRDPNVLPMYNYYDPKADLQKASALLDKGMEAIVEYSSWTKAQILAFAKARNLGAEYDEARVNIGNLIKTDPEKFLIWVGNPDENKLKVDIAEAFELGQLVHNAMTNEVTSADGTKIAQLERDDLGSVVESFAAWVNTSAAGADKMKSIRGKVGKARAQREKEQTLETSPTDA